MTTARGADLLEAAMIALAALAAQDMVEMASDQRVTIEPTEPEPAELATYAAVVAALMGSGLGSFAGQEALRRAIPGSEGPDIARQVDTAIANLTDSAPRRDLGAALWSASNAGRYATLVAADPPAVYYVANEIRDRNTCRSCRRIDGQIFPTIELARESYPNGGYIGCEGGARCRGTYDPVWGVPPVQPKVPEDAQPYHADLDGIEDLAAMRLAVRAAEAKKTLKVVKLTGGMSADTTLNILPDGRRIVHKKGPRWGDVKDNVSQADAEQLSSELARRLGIKAPRVYRDEKDAVWIEYVHGRTLGDLDDEGGAWSNRRDRVLSSGSAKRAGLIDVLTGDGDRNSGNILVDDDDELIGIDRGGGWLAQQLGEGASAKWADSDFFSTAGTGRSDLGFVDNPLTRQDVKVIRRTLRSMAASFEKLGRGDWLGWTQDMLDQIEEYAAGEENLIEEG